MSDNRQDTAAHHAAFEEIVSRHEGALLRYVAHILNNNYHAAQDVVQDAFIKLFDKWTDDFNDAQRLSAWLYSVTHNMAVDYIRKESRRNMLHKHGAENMPTAERPDVSKGEGGTAELVENAMNILDDREKQLVVLKVLEGKSYREISEITGLTVGNVGYILHHAVKKMSDEIKKVRQ